jgi:hypothetical protein
MMTDNSAASSTTDPPSGIGEFEVAALSASSKGDHEKAISLMREAVKLEEAMGAPSGPPSLIKPTNELFGEILLRAGNAAEAREQFRLSLLRQPNRARSLLGLARAAAKAGDEKGATATYAKLLEQWKQPDSDLPELREAREFVEKHKAGG